MKGSPYQRVEPHNEDPTERRIQRTVRWVVVMALVTFLVGISVAVAELMRVTNHNSTNASSASNTPPQRADVSSGISTQPPTEPRASPRDDGVEAPAPATTIVTTEDDESPTNEQDDQGNGGEGTNTSNGEDDMPNLPQDNDEAADVQAATSRVEAPPAMSETIGVASAMAATRGRVVVGARDAMVNGVRITGTVLVYEQESTFGPWNVTQQLLAPDMATTMTNNRTHGLKFGSAVALSDQTMIVGAPGTASQNNGVAYIFGLQSNGFWHFLQQLTAPLDAELNDAFGTSVALEDNVLLVGAPGANQVYLFEQNRTTELWSLREVLQPRDNSNSGPTERFGSSMALKNGLLVVGAPGGDEDLSDGSIPVTSGRAYVYRRRPNNHFAPKATLTASDDGKSNAFGAAVATDEATIVIGAPSSNAAYVFEASTTTANTWIEVSKLEIPIQSIKRFGSAVAVEQELIAVAASFHEEDCSSQSTSGIAYVFVKGCVAGNRTDWGLRNQLLDNKEIPSDDSFSSVLQIQDGVVVMGSSYPGEVLFYNIPIALGPSCAPIKSPSVAPQNSPAPTNLWTHLNSNPSLRPTTPQAIVPDSSRPVGSNAPAPTFDSKVVAPCEDCQTFTTVAGFKVYRSFWFGSICTAMCVPPSFLKGTESLGWSCSPCG